MNSSNLVICLGYGYNIFNLGAIFASFTHSDLICFTDNIAQLPLKLSDTTGAVARALALGFNRNAGIAAPLLALLPQVIQAVRLGLLAFMTIALATRWKDLRSLQSLHFGWLRARLPHSCARCHKRIPGYISSDPACWKMLYLMPALSVYRLDISGTSAGRPCC